MSNSRISVPEAVSIVLIILVAHTLVSLPKSLLKVTGSATIINLLYVGIIMFFLVLLIVKLFKGFAGQDIIDISNFLGGPIFQKIVGMIFIFYFIFSSSILLRNFCECLKTVYYPMTSLFFILLTFIIALCISNNFNFSVTAKINLIILPIIFVSILFIFFANNQNLSFENMAPILGNGLFDTFVTGLGNLGAFGGIVFLYFIPPYLKEPKKFKKVAMISIGLSIVYLIICVAIILLTFTFLLKVDEIMPLYSAARYIEFGSFFQRLESILLLIWIIGMACYFSITLHITMNIFKKITNISDSKPLLVPFALLMLSISLLPSNYSISKYLETDIYPRIVIWIGLVLSTLILILAYFKKRIKTFSHNNSQGQNISSTISKKKGFIGNESMD